MSEEVFVTEDPLIQGDYIFIPKSDITVQELAALFTHLRFTCDQKDLDGFNPSVRRHFLKVKRPGELPDAHTITG